MLTETQLDQLDAIFRDDGRHIRMLAAAAYIIVSVDHQRIGRDEYATHEQAALALINGTYTPLAVRVETCVQHGAKNKPQWAKVKPQAVVQL